MAPLVGHDYIVHPPFRQQKQTLLEEMVGLRLAHRSFCHGSAHERWLIWSIFSGQQQVEWITPYPYTFRFWSDGRLPAGSSSGTWTAIQNAWHKVALYSLY